MILLNTNTICQNVTFSLAPAILTQPQSFSGFWGANVTFSVAAGGTAPLAYQWYFNQTNAIVNATNASLALSGLSAGQSGGYSVVITNSFGSITSAVAVLRVAQPLTTSVSGRGSVASAPGTNGAALGQPVTLTATPLNSWYAFLAWSDGNTNNPRTITVTPGNNLYTAIFTNLIPMELHVLKQWEADFGGTGNDNLASIQPTPDGGYILGGASSSPPSGNKYATNYGGFNFWVVKIDAFGNKQWERTFGGVVYDQITSLQQTTDGGFILGGISSSPPSGNKTSPNYGGNDFWVVRLDSNGNKLWENEFGGPGDDELTCLQQTADGGFILGGYSDSPPGGTKTSPNYGGYDMWVVRIDANGNKLWDQSYGGVDADELVSLPTNHRRGLCAWWNLRLPPRRQ